MFSMKSGCAAALVLGSVLVAACSGDFGRSDTVLTGPSPATPAGLGAAAAGASLRVTPAGGTATGADLQMSGSASTGSPDAGAQLTYTFQVKNTGPDSA